MKTNIFAIVMLIASIAIYAQPSRRSENGKNEKGQRARNSADNKVDNNRNSNRQQYGEIKSGTRESEQTRENKQENKSEVRSYQRNNDVSERNRNTDYQSTQTNRKRETEHNNDKRGNFNTSTHEHNDREYRESRELNRFDRDHSNVVEIRRPGTRFEVVRYRPNYHHNSIEYRREHYAYRIPYRNEIIWSFNLSHNFGLYYPEVRFWRYPIGYHIAFVPAYNAEDYIGEVVTIYGKVFDSYYAYENDELYLYFGDSYPYQDFSIVIPGQEARKFTRNPEQYFNEQHVSVTGYVTRYGDKPEILVRQANQIDLY